MPILISPEFLVLDDMQWADPPSRSLVQALCSDMSSKNVLIVLACRDKDYHTLRVDLLKNVDRSLETSTIVLKGLNCSSITEMLTSTLGLEASAADSLADVLSRKTNGNVHHVIQYLKHFRDEGLLFLLNDSSQLHKEVSKAEEITASIDELLRAQMVTLDLEIRYILSVAACVGYRFDIRLLIACAESKYNYVAEPMAREHLNIACRKGFITQLSHFEYMFNHDNVQQSFYAIMQQFAEREEFHLNIGSNLCEMVGGTEEANDALIFLAVDHMNQGSSLITCWEQRKELARLNLVAGRVSMDKTAFNRAAQYFRNGIQLVSSGSMWTDDYNLACELHKRLASTALILQDFDESDIVVAEIAKNAISSADTLEAGFIKLESLSARGDHIAGVAFSLKLLSMIEFPLNETPNGLAVAYESARTRHIIRQYNDDDILTASQRVQPSENAAMKALSFLTMFAYCAKRKLKQLFSLAILKMMQLAFKDCLGPYSANAFIWYGVLQAKLGKRDMAHRFCSLGSNLASKMRSSAVEVFSLIVASFVVSRQQKPLVEISRGLKEAFNTSLRFHGHQTSVLGALGHNSAAFFCGDVRLSQVEEESRFVVQCMRQMGFGDQLKLALPILQVSICLQETTQDPGKLSGKFTDGERATAEAMNECDAPVVQLIIGLRLLLALLFEKWGLVQTLLTVPIDANHFDTPYWTFSFTTFIRGIGCLKMYRRTRERRYLREGFRLKRVLQKLAGRNCPGCKGKVLLLQAELMSWKAYISPDNLLNEYKRAIDTPGGCKESLLDEALANERAAFCMMERNDIISTRQFAIQAINCYSRWGATAKVKWLATYFVGILGEGGQNALDSSVCTGQSGSDSSTLRRILE